MGPKGRGERVQVGGHTLQLTNLDKVLYPATGTTKGDVLGYYAAVAEWMLPHVEGRPATRKRWVNGVDGQVFFEKNLPDSAPEWVARRGTPTGSCSTSTRARASAWPSASRSPSCCGPCSTGWASSSCR